MEDKLKQLSETAVIEVAWRMRYHKDQKHLECMKYKEIRDLILDIAEKFKNEYQESLSTFMNVFMNMPTKYYSMCADAFTDMEIAKELWKRYDAVQKDKGDKHITEEWNGFSKGTSCEAIQYWFKRVFGFNIVKHLTTVE